VQRNVKAHIPEARTQTFIFPGLSSGFGGRKGDEEGERKRGRGRDGGENPDLGEAESRSCARPSPRASRTTKRIVGCPGPNAAEGEDPARPTGNVFHFSFAWIFFSIALVRTKIIALDAAIRVTCAFCALRMKVQLNRKLLPKGTVVNRAIKYCAIRKDPISQTISINTFRAEPFLLFIRTS